MVIRTCLLLFAFAAIAFGAEHHRYAQISVDSLTPGANIVLSSAVAPTNQDSSYCRSLVPLSPAQVKQAKDTLFSSFKCDDGVVSQFTFVNYEGGFLNVLFKPDRANHEYFGKASFDRNKVGKVYSVIDGDGPTSEMTSKDMDRLTGGIGTAVLIIVGIGALYLILVGGFLSSF